MHLVIDGKTVPLTHTAGSYEAVTEIDGERYLIHATITKVGRRAVSPAKAVFTAT